MSLACRGALLSMHTDQWVSCCDCSSLFTPLFVIVMLSVACSLAVFTLKWRIHTDISPARHRPGGDHIFGCVCVRVCIHLQIISHVIRPISLILFVHIYDCVLKDLSWSQWFTILDKPNLLTALFHTAVIMLTLHSSWPEIGAASDQGLQFGILLC